MDMEKNSIWGILILIFLFFIVFNRDGVFAGNRGNDHGMVYPMCGVVSNCEVEKSQIIDSARNLFAIENTSRNTQDAVLIDGEKTRTKIDFYAYEGLKDQLAQERTKNVALENKLYNDGQFNALRSELAACCCKLNNEIAGLPKAPPYWAQGFISCGNPIPPMPA